MGELSDNLERADWIHERLDLERKLHAAHSRVGELRRLHRELHRKLDISEQDLALVLDVARNDKPVAPIRPRDRRRSEAAAVLLLSDVHIGETVDPDTVNGSNEYTPEIAEQRLEQFFRSAAEWVIELRAHQKVDHLILWLGGDVITGYESAPELQETNTLGPCQEVVFGRRHFRRGIAFLLDALDPKRLTIPCSMGNHGRITDKLRFSTMKRTSLEHILYQVLAGDFREDKRVQFLIPDGFTTYLDVFDTTCRFMHGDTLSGGASGAALYGGLIRAMAKQDRDRRAQLTCIGHFHRYLHVQDGGRHGIVNGSVVGPSAYSTRFGGYDLASQVGVLIDSKAGVVYSRPLEVRV